MLTCKSRYHLSVLLLLAFIACSSSQALPPVELHPALPFVSTALIRLQAPGEPWALFWGSILTDEKADVCGYGGVNISKPTVVHYDETTRELEINKKECVLDYAPFAGVYDGFNLTSICTDVAPIPPDHCAIYLSSENITDKVSPAPTLGSNCAGCWGTDCRCVAVDNVPACFPSRAVVTVVGRGAIRMTELKTGDRVLSVAKDGTPCYDPIYFWGHRDSVALSRFVALDVSAPGRRQATIMMSPRHFLPLGDSLKTSRYMYARDIKPGDTVIMADTSGSATGTVTAKRMGGHLVVDGVVASSHSDWVLDDVVPPSMVPYLPVIYQAIFWPIYWAQQLFPANWIDHVIAVGAAHGSI
ncbi:probable Indian hedgehog protein at C-terminar half [Coccomyxa sp. Obi]|nr:probable Indian hedgehog protein at C-terminar half [Coccomyxa sp. Obi]